MVYMKYNENLPIEGNDKGIKLILKRIIRKAILPFVSPIVQYQNEQNEMISKELSKLSVLYEKSVETIKELSAKNDHLAEIIDTTRTDLGAVSRQVMLAKWKILDHLQEEDEEFVCDICGFTGEINEVQTIESKCIFNGGVLKRYICPRCGVIIGPSKFIGQGQSGIDEDYWVHYLGFSEGDSSEKEEKAFRMLEPEMNKVYLNYGCGKWSKTLQKLREEGYNVYGYEPYAPESDNPYLITSKEKLSRMRFDGIFSNDLLEHLLNPIEDLKFMAGLLWDEKSKMAHSTCCFEYRYEYTRFHTHFFVGKSREILAQKAGLMIEKYYDDLLQSDFICSVYKPIECNNHCLNNDLYLSNGESAKNGIIDLHKGEFAYGPYVPLGKGIYNLCIELQGEAGTLEVTNGNGVELLLSNELQPGENNVKFVLDEAKDGVEFVIRAQDGDVRIVNCLLDKE